MTHARRVFPALILIICLIILSGCSHSDSLSVNPAVKEHMAELVQEFVNTLEGEIIPNSTSLIRLIELEPSVTVSTENHTYNMEDLEAFYSEYQELKNTEITIVFYKQTLVVTRIKFEGGFGYYFRYQYSPEHSGGMLPVSGRLIEKIALEENEADETISLLLYNESDKQEVAKFVFKDIVRT